MREVDQLEQVASQYVNDSQTIMSNGMLSSEGKQKKLAELRAWFVPEAEARVKAIWGDVSIESDDRTLSSQGAAWASLETANRRITETKSQAEAIDPARLQVARQRAESMLKNVRRLNEVADLYRNASSDVQIAMQEFGGALLADREDAPDANWSGFVRQLERDRDHRVFTPDVLKALERHAETVKALDRAWRLTEQLVKLTAEAPHLAMLSPIGKIAGMIERYQDQGKVPGEKPVTFYNYRRKTQPKNRRGG